MSLQSKPKSTVKAEFNVNVMNIAFDELAIKYGINRDDILNVFVLSLENIFSKSILCSVEKECYVFYISSNMRKLKKVSFSERIRKELEHKFNENIEKYCNDMKVDRAKRILKNKEVIKFEILKIDREEKIIHCKTIFGLAFLYMTSIPKPDLKDYSMLGTKHLATIHSYKRNGLIVLDVKSNEVELEKTRDVIRDVEVLKVNRYYGVRTKIYTDKIPSKISIDLAKMLYSEEKIIIIPLEKKRWARLYLNKTI